MYLLETLDVKFSGLLDQLYSDQVVSAVERDDISAERTSFRANEKLLSVLSRKSPQQFQLFLHALDNCGQPHVRGVVDDWRGLWIKIIYLLHAHITVYHGSDQKPMTLLVKATRLVNETPRFLNPQVLRISQPSILAIQVGHTSHEACIT